MRNGIPHGNGQGAALRLSPSPRLPGVAMMIVRTTGTINENFFMCSYWVYRHLMSSAETNGGPFQGQGCLYFFLIFIFYARTSRGVVLLFLSLTGRHAHTLYASPFLRSANPVLRSKRQSYRRQKPKNLKKIRKDEPHGSYGKKL